MLIILLFSIEPLVYRSFSIDRYLYTLPLRKTCQLLQRNTMADDDDAVQDQRLAVRGAGRRVRDEPADPRAAAQGTAAQRGDAGGERADG